MAEVVNTNLQSVKALDTLNQTNKGLGKSFDRISNGLRVNKESDDAAGLGVSESILKKTKEPQQGREQRDENIAIVKSEEKFPQEDAVKVEVSQRTRTTKEPETTTEPEAESSASSKFNVEA